MWFHVRDAIKVLTYKILETGSDMFYANLTGSTAEDRRKKVKDMIKKAGKARDEGAEEARPEGQHREPRDPVPRTQRCCGGHGGRGEMSVDEQPAKWKEAMGKIRALEQEMKRLSSRVDAPEGGGSKKREESSGGVEVEEGQASCAVLPSLLFRVTSFFFFFSESAAVTTCLARPEPRGILLYRPNPEDLRCVHPYSHHLHPHLTVPRSRRPGLRGKHGPWSPDVNS